MVWIVVTAVVAVALAALITAVMFSYVRGEFYFSRVRDNDQLTVQIKALSGLIRYKFEVPVIQFKSFSRGVLVKAEAVNETRSKLKEENQEHITKHKIERFYRQAREIVEHTLSFSDWMKQTLAHVECTSLTWNTRVGVGDAPETAITTGLVWTLKSSLLGFVFRWIDMQTKPRVMVEPLYNALEFTTMLRVRGRIRAGMALWSGLRLLVRIIREKGGLRTWYRLVVKPRRRKQLVS
ncbi:DUF2953 domain-containing protein [Paenibacillus athensensis]|uniref:DUF2953 domain-containing protein n=1 Tax=Paenibacillus athensensis TaxID=1967502 RepID=A0A4Y8PTV3_9BACL|nr:DUF2953 domain-containing protein [Paenibacillus athensensis]MCD1260758.1 DUF2953 domain-containing protein [Paenibacillus athensensis]